MGVVIMITKMIFVKLFGRFDYEIALKPEGVTILTGPNGFGKSTILRCIEALSEGNIFFFSQLDFKKLEILSDSSQKIYIIEKIGNELFFNKDKISLDKNTMNSFIKNRYFESYNINNLTIKESDLRSAWAHNNLNEIPPDYWKSFIEIKKELPKDYDKIVRQLKAIVGRIYLIKEQRLIKEKKNGKSEQEIINVIEELPSKFKNLINNISSNYSAISNKLDSTYPNRLFTMESSMDKEEYIMKMDEMTNKFEKLSKYDISEMLNSTNVAFNKEHAKALKIYFDDFNEKYKVYEDFIKKLDLFTDMVNCRLTFKKIKISRDIGILVTDEEKLNETLKLSQLSSGEKQIIVLFYELIFETTNDVLLLIDEPEISLHIVWQKMFMNDLLKIVEYKGLKVIVATHSSQIINNHWNRQIDLGDLYGDQLDNGKLIKR